MDDCDELAGTCMGLSCAAVVDNLVAYRIASSADLVEILVATAKHT